MPRLKITTRRLTVFHGGERVSTAASRIVGYSADDVAMALGSLFRKETDAAGCVKMMDDYRIAEAKAQGAEGF